MRNGIHQHAAQQAERHLIIEVVVPPVVVEHPAEALDGERGAKILKRVNDAGGESDAFSPADVHRRRRAEQRVRGIDRERNQHEEQAPEENPQRRRPDNAGENDSGGDENEQ